MKKKEKERKVVEGKIGILLRSVMLLMALFVDFFVFWLFCFYCVGFEIVGYVVNEFVD